MELIVLEATADKSRVSKTTIQTIIDQMQRS
jgi:hypothetical protein